uniref:CD209 antigen-like protein C isoform X2 n=1 Tax=Monopterus albus TaxID=43700 RepID=UPI0009B41235|nr:CD209 antigen-like protein C isoform X2 [Monopterus albus]
MSGQSASNISMDSSERRPDVEAKRATPADPASPRTCRLTSGMVVAVATVVLIGLLLPLVLFVMWMAAPQVAQTSGTSGQELVERLQQCQNGLRDLNLMLHTATQGGWLWWRGHCYFFSVGLEENRQWNASAEFCQLHNSSLAVIKDPAEMEFIQGVMRKFSRFPFLWVGLTDSQQEGRWLWWDGTDIQRYMPVTVEFDSEHRDCADLRGGGRLFAVDCEAYGPWACKRAS